VSWQPLKSLTSRGVRDWLLYSTKDRAGESLSGLAKVQAPAQRIAGSVTLKPGLNVLPIDEKRGPLSVAVYQTLAEARRIPLVAARSKDAEPLPSA
jgi:hypothetical protein